MAKKNIEKEIESNKEFYLDEVKRVIKKYEGCVVKCGPAKMSNPIWDYFYAVIDFNRILDRENENDMNFIKKVIVDELKGSEDPDNLGYYWIGDTCTNNPVCLFIKGLGNIDNLKAVMV
jgi:hypothetical protein